MSGILETVLAVEAEGEAEIRKSLTDAGVSEKGVEGAVGAYRALQAFKDELPKDAIASVLKATGYDPEEKEADEPADPAEDIQVAELPEAVRAQVEAVFKANAENAKRLEVVQKELSVERDARLTEHYVEKAKREFAHIPGESAELGEVLKSLNAVDSKIGEAVEKVLKSAEELIASGTVMSSQGATSPVGVGDAWAQIEALAKERIAKGLDTNKDVAISAVIAEHPTLYTEYNKTTKTGV